MLRPKKNSCKEFDNEKKFLQLENSPPPHNFSNGPSLIPLWKDGVDQSPEVVGNFLRWSEKNSMSCNPGKSKELTMRKNGFLEELCKIHNLPQCSEFKLLGVIFQYNCKHASHVREKLVKANKCLHVVRTLR